MNRIMITAIRGNDYHIYPQHWPEIEIPEEFKNHVELLDWGNKIRVGIGFTGPKRESIKRLGRLETINYLKEAHRFGYIPEGLSSYNILIPELNKDFSDMIIGRMNEILDTIHIDRKIWVLNWLVRKVVIDKNLKFTL